MHQSTDNETNWAVRMLELAADFMRCGKRDFALHQAALAIQVIDASTKAVTPPGITSVTPLIRVAGPEGAA